MKKILTLATIILTLGTIATRGSTASGRQQLPATLAPDKSDPLYQSRGDQQRHYRFPEADNADQPYRIYVPRDWDGKTRLALVVILHGGGLDHNAPFDRAPADLNGVLQREADSHDFILVAPEGYKNGHWGNEMPIALSQILQGLGNPTPAGCGAPGSAPVPAAIVPPAPPVDPTAPEVGAAPRPRPCVSSEESARDNRLAELDVLHVIGLVSAEYNTNPMRLYLMGNSAGMVGTLHLAAKYNKMFTAIGPSDGPVDPTTYPYTRLKGIGGVMITHGEADKVAPIDDSEVIAFLSRQQGIDTRFERVPGGGHGDSWYKRVPQIFDFFAQHTHRSN